MASIKEVYEDKLKINCGIDCYICTAIKEQG